MKITSNAIGRVLYPIDNSHSWNITDNCPSEDYLAGTAWDCSKDCLVVSGEHDFTYSFLGTMSKF